MTVQTPPTITLEPRTSLHAEALFVVLADPILYQYIEEAPPESVEALRQKFARTESGKSPDGTEHWLNWAVRDASGRVAGYVQATVGANGEAHIAYMLGREFWGGGIARQAVALMIEILTREFEVKRLNVVAERPNERSIRLASSLGFEPASAALRLLRQTADRDVLLQRAFDAAVAR